MAFLPPLSARARPALLGAGLSAVAFLGGCGSDTAAPTSKPEPPVAPVGGTVDTTPQSASEGAGTVSGGKAPKGTGDFSAPAGADAPELPRASASKGLRVASADGAKPRWVVNAKRGGDGDFCVRLAIPGPYDPDPLCQTGELLALQFFSSGATGPAFGTVVQAPLTARESPSQLVVAGLASAGVDTVRVRYGQKTFDAALSERAVDLPVNQSLARELSGATRDEVARLPDPVAVRAFGVSFPRDAGNPPRVVTPETVRPVNGVITLQLS
ncbi:MAG: hypothetical protein JHD16_02855 [Solirubrobacteraceae bacterium]|nr:hypothetical protein [Solirubrobacteraceae bacterium]